MIDVLQAVNTSSNYILIVAGSLQIYISTTTSANHDEGFKAEKPKCRNRFSELDCNV